MKTNERTVDERLPNYELLRCICIVYIILFHCVYKSNIDLQISSANTFFIESLYLLGKMGVNVFILISGYFYSKSEFKWKKVIDLWLLVQFYTLFSIITKIFVFHETFRINGLKELIRLLFPLSFGKYWFVTAYVLIYIFSPYIKNFVSNLSKTDFTKLIFLFIGIWSVWGTAVGVINSDTTNLVYYHQYFWLFIMYLCGVYIKMYGMPFVEFTRVQYLFIVSGVFLINFIYIVVYHLYPEIMNKIGLLSATFFWRENSILSFIGSIALFMFFAKLDIKNSKVINQIAATTFGIYLLHDGLLQNNIWGDLVHVNKYIDSWFCIPYIFISVILIFLICSLIEYVRGTVFMYLKRIFHKR